MCSLRVFKIPIPYWGSLGETDAVPHERSKERRGKSTFLFQHPVLTSYPSNTGLAGGDDDGVKSLSRVPVFAAPWPIAHQAPLSMGFPRQEYWNGWPFPSPRELPDPGIELSSSAFGGGFFTSEPPGKYICQYKTHKSARREIKRD